MNKVLLRNPPEQRKAAKAAAAGRGANLWSGLRTLKTRQHAQLLTCESVSYAHNRKYE